MAMPSPRLRALGRVLAEYADRAGPPITLALLIAYFALSTDRFWQADNFVNIGTQEAALGIVAVGETLVIISAGIDLSVGSVVALSGVVAAVAARKGVPLWGAALFGIIVGAALAVTLLRRTRVPAAGVVALGAAAAVALAAATASAGAAPIWVAAVMGIAAGALAGACSGLVTALARMPSFVVTLGMMLVCRGAAHVLQERKTVMLPASFEVLRKPWEVGLAQDLALKIPPLLMVVAVVAVLMALLLRHTPLGRYAYALGGNREAARLSGVPVAGTEVAVFTICGLLCGLAGVLLAGRLGGVSPTSGEFYELRAIAAVVIGGTSLMGGRGAVGGTIVGFLIMGVLRNGLNLKGAEPPWQKIAVGTTIIIAVFLDHLRRRRRAG